MRVLIMEPGRLPVEIETTEGKLLKLTGGYAMALGRWALPSLPDGIFALVREFDWEGEAQDAGANFETKDGHVFYGPLVVAGDGAKDYVGLTDQQVSDTLGAIARDLTRIGMAL